MGVRKLRTTVNQLRRFRWAPSVCAFELNVASSKPSRTFWFIKAAWRLSGRPAAAGGKHEPQRGRA
jgi:hypothetical protein